MIWERSKDTDRHRKKILKQSMYGYTDSDGSLCGRSWRDFLVWNFVMSVSWENEDRKVFTSADWDAG